MAAAQLAQRPPTDTGLPLELDKLAQDYRLLHNAIQAFDQTLRRETSSLAARAAQAGQRLADVQTAFRRKAARAQRSRNPGRPVSTTGQRQLDGLQASLQQLEQQRAALPPPVATIQLHLDQLAQLTAAYKAFAQAATQLWQAECPREYAAATRPAPGVATSSALSAPGAPSASHSSSSATSDSSWQSSTDPSSPSSDGGSW